MEVVQPKEILRKKFPALAHTRRQRLIAHCSGIDPFAGTRLAALKVHGLGAIRVNPVLIDVHGKLQMRKDVNQWREMGDIARFAHINGRTGAKARYVFRG